MARSLLRLSSCEKGCHPFRRRQFAIGFWRACLDTWFPNMCFLCKTSKTLKHSLGRFGKSSFVKKAASCKVLPWNFLNSTGNDIEPIPCRTRQVLYPELQYHRLYEEFSLFLHLQAHELSFPSSCSRSRQGPHFVSPNRLSERHNE